MPKIVNVFTDDPCPRCLELARHGKIRVETVQRLPAEAFAPLGYNRQKCCYDCASADTLTRMQNLDFEMARIAVGNDRQDQYRLPGAPMGLVLVGIVRPSAPGDFEKHLKWLDKHVYSVVPEGTW